MFVLLSLSVEEGTHRNRFLGEISESMTYFIYIKKRENTCSSVQPKDVELYISLDQAFINVTGHTITKFIPDELTVPVICMVFMDIERLDSRFTK